MADRPTRIGGLGIGADQVFGAVNDVQKQLDAILVRVGEEGSVGVDLPEVDAGFTPIFEIINGEIFVTLAYFIPGYASELRIWMIRRDLAVDNPSYHNQRIKDSFVLTDEDRTAFPASVEHRFEKPLKGNKTYDVILLDAFDFNGNIHSNPETPPKFAGYPGNVLFTFNTGSGANEPSKPSLARIIANTIQVTDDGLIAVVTVRVFANDAETLTFGEQQITGIQVKFQDTDVTTIRPKRFVTIDDPSADFIDIEMGSEVVLGREYSWISNVGWSGDEFAAATPASPVTFFAGGFADPSDLTDLTLVAYTAALTDDPGTLAITLTLNQPDPPFRLKNCTVKRKISANADSDYDLAKNLIEGRKSLLDPIYNVDGDIDIEFLMPVRPAKTYKIKTKVRVVGGFDKDFESGDIFSGDLLLPASVTAAQGGPSYVDGGGMRASLKDYDDTYNPPGAAGDAKYLGQRWETFANSGVRIDNLGSGGGGSFDADGVDWVSTEARLLLDTTLVTRGGKPAVILGKILAANQDWSGNVLLRAKVADVTADITMAFVNGGGDICTATATGFVIPVAEYKPLFFILLVPNGFTRNGKEWLEMRFAANPSNQVVTAQWQLEPGIAYHSFKMHSREANVSPTTNPSDNGEGAVTQLPIIVVDDAGGEFSRTGTLAGEISLL